MAAGPVLVVDDDPDNRALMRYVLRSEGYSVATARDGREALERLAELQPAVILLDLEMPGMDGRDFRHHQLRLAAPLRSIPVILYSGSEEAETLTAELRPFACLPKPLSDFTPLLEQLEAACQFARERSLAARAHT